MLSPPVAKRKLRAQFWKRLWVLYTRVWGVRDLPRNCKLV